MSFLGISQLSSGVYAPAWSPADGLGPADGNGSSMADAGSATGDPTAFAQRCTNAADSLASCDPGAAQGGNAAPSDFFAPSQGGSSPLTGLLNLVASLFGASGSGATGSSGFSPLPGIAKTIAGLIA